MTQTFYQGFATLVTFLFFSSVCAASQPGQENCEEVNRSPSQLSKLPSALKHSTTPKAPPQLRIENPAKSFGCQRQFAHQKKLIQIDSYHGRDGERLRKYIEDVPAAVSELNEYQSNRRSVQTAAYIGTAGLVIAIASILLKESWDPDQQKKIRNIGVATGFGMTAGSLVYSFGVLRSNERHLENAIQHYNAAHPQDPLELKFSTGILF